MRSLIVKYLALSYRVRLFKKEFVFPRAANILIPLLLLLGYALVKNDSYPVLDLFTIVSLILNAIVWFTVIVYLKVYPVKWYELDREQKWFFGNGVLSGKTKAVFEDGQFQEWQSIKHKERVNNKKFRNVLAFLVNPLALMILLFLIY